jgi:hypothetical protein
MGKKDIGTERMIHTSSWLFEHFNVLLKAMSAKVGKAIFRIDTGVSSSTFGGAAAATSTGSAPSFRYSSSSTTVYHLQYRSGQPLFICGGKFNSQLI